MSEYALKMCTKSPACTKIARTDSSSQENRFNKQQLTRGTSLARFMHYSFHSPGRAMLLDGRENTIYRERSLEDT